MNRAQLLSILDQHEESIKAFGSEKADTSQLLKFDPNRVAFCHVRWMLAEMRRMLEPFAEVTPENFYAAQTTLEKVGRWLGFVQGVLWSFGVCSIDEMRDLNRPK